MQLWASQGAGRHRPPTQPYSREEGDLIGRVDTDRRSPVQF